MTKQDHREYMRTQPIGQTGIQACFAIVEAKQYRKVNEVMVDLFSASAITKVYEALSPENRLKLEALPVQKAASVCFKLLK